MDGEGETQKDAGLMRVRVEFSSCRGAICREEGDGHSV